MEAFYLGLKEKKYFCIAFRNDLHAKSVKNWGGFG
jgi:hypothetical protein